MHKVKKILMYDICRYLWQRYTDFLLLYWQSLKLSLI